MVEATVVTIRTSIRTSIGTSIGAGTGGANPGPRTVTHMIIIRGGRARSTAEQDTWRLFDTKAKTVTFVDDIDGTIHTETMAAIEQRMREAMERELPAHYPAARLIRGEATKPMLGVTARQSVIEAGAYRRSLWLAEHPSIPNGLFAMMTTAEPPSSPLAPMVRTVGEALAKEDGFPLLDHAEVAYGDAKMVIDRVVTSIDQREVPLTSITIPKGYRDVTRP
jgi:hypothetical protein